MNLYLVFIIISSLIGIQFFIKNFNKDYLSKENTSCIKGIFILIVFYSHICTYMIVQPEKDGLMFLLKNLLGQLMVTMFLFYSGYGVFESIKKKKEKYINTIPKRRFLKTLINFDIAVLTFVIINLIIGVNLDLKRILLAFIGWTSVGNSNWYIFAILLLYLATYASFKIFDKDNNKAISLNWILTVAIMIIIGVYRGPGNEYCYNTLLCYPLGMTYSLYKGKIEKVLFNNQKYILITIILIVCFIAFRRLDLKDVVWYSIYSIIFVMLIVAMTMKINLKSKILKWCGDNLFWLYILQRIPMLILSKTGYAKAHAYRYALICFVITIILTVIYDKGTKLLHEKILKLN